MLTNKTWLLITKKNKKKKKKRDKQEWNSPALWCMTTKVWNLQPQPLRPAIWISILNAFIKCLVRKCNISASLLQSAMLLTHFTIFPQNDL